MPILNPSDRANVHNVPSLEGGGERDKSRGGSDSMLVDSDVGASSGVRSRAGGESMIAGLRCILTGSSKDDGRRGWYLILAGPTSVRRPLRRTPFVARGTFDFLWFCIAIGSCWAIFSKEDVECVEDGE